MYISHGELLTWKVYTSLWVTMCIALIPLGSSRLDTFDVSSLVVWQARHSQNAWARHVEQRGSTCSRQPECMGSTRRTCGDVTSQVEFGLMLLLTGVVGGIIGSEPHDNSGHECRVFGGRRSEEETVTFHQFGWHAQKATDAYLQLYQWLPGMHSRFICVSYQFGLNTWGICFCQWRTGFFTIPAFDFSFVFPHGGSLTENCNSECCESVIVPIFLQVLYILDWFISYGSQRLD